jgi:hypothetical protein
MAILGWGVLLSATASLADSVTVVGALTRQVTLPAGGRSEGQLVLQNASDKPRQAKVYQTDYLFSADGSSTYGEPGSAPRSNCSWITFTPRQLEIAPGQNGSVYYTIQAPQNAQIAGTYWSLLMVEPLTADSPEVAAPKEAGKVKVGLRTVMRYAVQMVTNIGDTGQCTLKFADKQLVAQEGKRLLQLDVENTGERWLTPAVWAEVHDAQGQSLGKFEARRIRIYPGCSARFAMDLSSLPAGQYNALVVADNGDEHVFGAQYKLDVK